MERLNPHPDYAAPNVVTLLTAKGKILTKTITEAGEKLPADTPSLFTHAAEPVDDLKDMFDLLRRALAQTDTYIVRPAVIEGAPDVIRRRCSAAANERGLIDVPRHWVMIDIDLPVIQFPRKWRATPKLYIRRLIEAALPEAFHAAGVIAQFSSGMSADGGTPKVHLWFWFDRPLMSCDVSAWLRGRPIDHRMYSGGQPHFTAAPIFKGGVDPLGEQRLVFLAGPVVEVPAQIDASTPDGTEVDLSVDISGFRNPSLGDTRWKRMVLQISDGTGLHNGILLAGMAYVRGRFDPQADDPTANIDYAEFERAVLDHVGGLTLTPEREADLRVRLADMERLFWGAVPKVRGEIIKQGAVLSAFAEMSSSSVPTLLELLAKSRKERSAS